MTVQDGGLGAGGGEAETLGSVICMTYLGVGGAAE